MFSFSKRRFICPVMCFGTRDSIDSRIASELAKTKDQRTVQEEAGDCTG